MESESRRFKNITSRQIEFLVTFMEKNPELVSGQLSKEFPLRKKTRLWEDLQKKLNSMNPSNFKSADRWKKTWVDKKCHVRNKATLYKKNVKNNEKEKGPKFTLLEKRIMKLIGLRQLSQVCPTAESRLSLPPLETQDVCNELLKSSDPKISFSGSLLPTMTESQLKESMEIDCVHSTVNGVFKSEPLPSKDTPNLENSPSLLFGEPTKTKESISLTKNTLEQQIIVKQEPLDGFMYETSSSVALESLNPIIVSVAPIITTGEPLSPIVKLAAPGLTESMEPQSPVIGAPAPSPSTEDLQSYSMINTAQGTKEESQVFELDSDSLITTTEKPELGEYNEDNVRRIRVRRRRVNKDKQSVAIKAADELTAMAERNCVILERIATAIEIQAAQSVKQTQLIDRLIDILSKK